MKDEQRSLLVATIVILAPAWLAMAATSYYALSPRSVAFYIVWVPAMLVSNWVHGLWNRRAFNHDRKIIVVASAALPLDLPTVSLESLSPGPSPEVVFDLHDQLAHVRIFTRKAFWHRIRSQLIVNVTKRPLGPVSITRLSNEDLDAFIYTWLSVGIAPPTLALLVTRLFGLSEFSIAIASWWYATAIYYFVYAIEVFDGAFPPAATVGLLSMLTAAIIAAAANAFAAGMVVFGMLCGFFVAFALGIEVKNGELRGQGWNPMLTLGLLTVIGGAASVWSEVIERDRARVVMVVSVGLCWGSFAIATARGRTPEKRLDFAMGATIWSMFIAMVTLGLVARAARVSEVVAAVIAMSFAFAAVVHGRIYKLTRDHPSVCRYPFDVARVAPVRELMLPMISCVAILGTGKQ